MGMQQILLILLMHWLLQHFFNRDAFQTIPQIPPPQAEFHTLLLHGQIRWKLKPEEDPPKLKQTEGKIFPQTDILMKLLIHLCLFAYLG